MKSVFLKNVKFFVKELKRLKFVLIIVIAKEVFFAIKSISAKNNDNLIKIVKMTMNVITI